MYVDLFGNVLSVGDIVIFSKSSSRGRGSKLDIGRITKFHDKSKMFSVEPVDKEGRRRQVEYWDGRTVPDEIYVGHYNEHKMFKIQYPF